MRELESKPASAEGAGGTGPTRKARLDRLTELIIGAAIEVHRVMGPGLLESVYEECLCYELGQLGLGFQRQVDSPIVYKGARLNSGYRMDLVVGEEIILELKTVEVLLPVHSAQLLTYLKLSGKEVGLLMNFNEPVLKKGLKRLVNYFREPSGKLISSASSALSRTRRLGVSAVNK